MRVGGGDLVPKPEAAAGEGEGEAESVGAAAETLADPETPAKHRSQLSNNL